MNLNSKKVSSQELSEEVKIKNEESISNLFIGKFDPTWAAAALDKTPQELDGYYKHYGYRHDGEYHYFDVIPPEQIDKEKLEWEIEYKYNKHFYRSDTFKKEHDGLHILFGGCSNTEGVGAPIERTWSYMVYQELSKENKVSGYFNIAKGGYGWHKIVSSFIEYARLYGTPDIFFVNHPNILRDYYWSEEREYWVYAQQYPYSTDRTRQDILLVNAWPEDHPYKELKINVYPELMEHRNKFPIWLTSWNLFLEYCKLLGTKVVWTTWDNSEDHNIKKSNLFNDSYFMLKPADPEFVKKIRPDMKLEKDDINARDNHPGFLTQLSWTECFLEFIDKEGVINEVNKKINSSL